MRFLVVASVLAFAAADLAPGAPLVPAQPTISAGDINGAVIEAHVEAGDAHIAASDHVRAAYDVNRQINDKVNELHGQAINNAEQQAWKAVDTVKTVEAKLDGAAAAAAPVLAKQLVRSGQLGPIPVPAPVAPIAPAPVAPIAPAPIAPSYASPDAAGSYSAPVISQYTPEYNQYAAPEYNQYAAPEYNPNVAVAPEYSPYASVDQFGAPVEAYPGYPGYAGYPTSQLDYQGYY